MKNNNLNLVASLSRYTFPLCAALALSLTLAAEAAPKRVLVISTTAGFRHSSIEVGNAVIEQLAKDSGAFTVEIVNVNPTGPEFRGPDGKLDAA